MAASSAISNSCRRSERLRLRDVCDRFRPRHHPRSLMGSWEEVAPPDLVTGIGRVRSDDDERGEIAVFGSQAVADPRTDARPGERKGAGVDAERRLVVIRVVSFHRADHAQVVDASRHLREEFADLGSTAAMRREFPLRALEKHLKAPLATLELRHGHRLPCIPLPVAASDPMTRHARRRHSCGGRSLVSPSAGNGANAVLAGRLLPVTDRRMASRRQAVRSRLPARGSIPLPWERRRPRRRGSGGVQLFMGDSDQR